MPSLLAFLFLASPAQAQTSAVLYTLGEGDDLLSRYGHAVLCIRPKPESGGKCFDFGHTDYSSPTKLIWEFMRKEGLYWAETMAETRMITHYKKRNQTIWVQTLPLDEAQTLLLAQKMEASQREETKYYVYHHFYDNCATRLRDPIDEVTGGKLAAGNLEPDGKSYREMAEMGLSGYLPLQIALELGLGREADPPTSPWQRMFLPDELRNQVQVKLGAEPKMVYHRVGEHYKETPMQGRYTVAGVGALLAIVGMGLKNKWLLRLIAVVLGGLATIFWSLAIVTALTELRWNEALLVLWPTDLAAPYLGRRYALARLWAVGITALLWAGGLFLQPLPYVLLLVGLPWMVVLWNQSRVTSQAR